MEVFLTPNPEDHRQGNLLFVDEKRGHQVTDGMVAELRDSTATN